MAATVISVGIQKGGCGKSTTAGMIVYLLSKKHKVLAIDMDGQANLTQLLSGEEDVWESFDQRTAFTAMKQKDLEGNPVTTQECITKINDNIDVIAGSELINTLGPYIYNEYQPKYKTNSDILKKAIEPIKDKYDFIIIDTPPALGELTYNSLAVSDYIIPMYETSKFCYLSLQSFFETIDHVRKNANPNLEVAGILRTMIDKRRSDNTYYCELVAKDYDGMVFNTIITRTAVVGRLPAYGLFENPEIKQVAKQYQPFFKELMNRVQVRREAAAAK